MQEETRPGESFPVEQDQRGTYIFNSRDLCLIEHLPELARAGVDSVKIEGRMKSLYYVAAVTRVYRAALDALRDPSENGPADPQWRKELEAVSHRPYGTGFLFGREDAFVHAEDSLYRRECDFVGIVKAAAPGGTWLVEGRNRIQHGDRLEMIGPGMRQATLLFTGAADQQGRELLTVQPNARVTMALPTGTRPGDLLRRWRTQDV